MLLKLLQILFLISGTFSSTRKKIIYEEERDKILSVRSLYKGGGKVMWIDDRSIWESLHDLRKLDRNELFNALKVEDSSLFLLIFLFNYTGGRPILIFPNVKSLQSLKISPVKGISLKGIFKNFRIYLMKSFEKVNTGCCTNSEIERTADNALLGEFEVFWRNKLERLAIMLLSREDFVEQSKLVQSRIRFLYKFLDSGFEFLLPREYKRVLEEIKTLGLEKSPAVKKFMFLSAHLVSHLKDINSRDFLKNFRWLASQDGQFITYIIYFYARSWKSVKAYLDYYIFGQVQEMERFVTFYISYERGILNLFREPIIKHQKIDKIRLLANIILIKTNNSQKSPSNKLKV